MKSGKYDLDGQILDVNGFDYKPLLTKGFFNLEHKGREDYSYLVGEPDKAYVKDGSFYVEGKLYKDNPKAVSIYQLGQILKKSGSSRKIGYSIEGKAIEKDPANPNRITKALISNVAITVSPKNDGTELIFKGEVDYEKQPGSELLIDITDDNGTRWTVDSNLNIEKGGPGSGRHKYAIGSKVKIKKPNPVGPANRMIEHDVTVDQHDISESGEAMYGGKNQKGKRVWFTEKDISKAMIAGDITGTETTDKNLTQQPLKQESVEGKKKKKKPVLKDQMSKAEVLTMLSSELNLDLESCKNVWGLIEMIERKNNFLR